MGVSVCPVPQLRSLPVKVSTMLGNSIFILSLVVVKSLTSEETEKEELLDGAESQNYGYGYGTKVDTPHGSSTVYVHGFGTDDGYDQYQGHHAHHAHHAHQGHQGPHQAYGYGHIDPYLNHKHGYGYSKAGYAGYNSLYAPHQGLHGAGHHGLAHHGLGVAHHGAHHGAHLGAHHLPVGYGPGYGAPQPFVGSGFRYGHGYGYGYIS